MSTTNSVQSIADFGATSGGPDCAPAFARAIAAAGPAGTVRIPPGLWYIESTVTTGTVNLKGDGWQSCIVVNLADTSQDAVVVNPSPQDLSTSVNLVQWSGVSIMGAQVDGGPCCQRGLVIDTVMRSVFRDVHVLVAAAEYCVYLRTGWSNTFNFICSNDAAGIYTAGGLPVGLPQQGFIYGAPATSVGALNANVFDCVCEGLQAPLLYLDNQNVQDTSQGDNWITGTYEAGTSTRTVAAYAIYAEGGYGLVITNVYTEATAGIYLKNCVLPVLTNTLVGTVVLDGTTDAWVDQMDLTQITILENCAFTRLGTLMSQAAASSPSTAGIIDLSSTTISLGSTDSLTYSNQVRYTSSALTNGDNLVLNGDFSRWVAGMPAGWVSSAGTVTQTGNGCGDPQTNLSTYAAKFDGTTAAPQFGYQLPALPGQWLGVSLYVYLPSGQALTQLELGMAQGATVQPSGVYAQVTDGWTKLQAVFFTGASGVAPVVGVQGNAAGSFYVADAQVSVGVAAPSSTFVPAACAMPVLYLGGQSISYGAAAPASGSWLQGDVVYNTAPAPGGWVGWVCTEGGTPGTWTQFGQIAG